MPSAAYNQTITASAISGIFNYTVDGGKCAAFYVRNTGSNGVFINIPGLHLTNDWFPIPTGVDMSFRLNNNGIYSVLASGNGGSTTIDYGVAAKIGSI